jgi:hypothetical protein
MVRRPLCLLALLALLACAPLLHADPGNPAIDAEAYLAGANQAMNHRSTHRISEEEFLRFAREPGTIVLDARSREKFELLHVEGAINLPLPEVDPESLARLLPDKNSRILIYCNNNFNGDPMAMMRKKASVSLNLLTFTTLYEYGYRNVYELAPLIGVTETSLPLVGLHTELGSEGTLALSSVIAKKTGTDLRSVP